MKISWLLLLSSLIAKSTAKKFRGTEVNEILGRVLEAEDFHKCMENLSTETTWPVPLSSRSTGRIDSAFGPVHSLCLDDDIFHKGVAIYGDPDDPVVAPYPGVVAMANEDCVVIEHAFESGDTCDFHGNEVDKWFSVFIGMKDVIVHHTNAVAAGDQIGKVGHHACKDGSHPRTTVEYQVRIGSRFSYKNAQEEGFTGQNYEPTVNPLYIHEELDFDHTVEDAESTTNGDVLISVTIADDAPVVNRYEIACDEGPEGAGAVHVLDLNLRVGFDKGDVLYENKSVPYLDAQPFGNFRTHWTGHLIIPKDWMGDEDKCTVAIFDIWGNKKEVGFDFPLES